MTDITEILDTNAKSNWAMVYEHDCWIIRASEEIKRLRAEIDQYENIIVPSWNREEELWRQDEKDAIEFRRVLVEEIERHEKAAEKALSWIESADHKPGCPRIRDDYDCTCGRDEVIQALYGVFEGAQ